MWSSLFGRDHDNDRARDAGTPSPAAEPAAAPEKPFAEQMRTQLGDVSWTARRAGDRLPVAALPRLGSIEDLLHPLLKHLRTSPPSVDEEIAVQAFVGDYLPTSINAYLSMNRQFALQPRADGRTPGDDLLEQLATLEQAIRELAQAVYAHDAQQLQVQGRFLSTKFSSTDLDL